MKIELDLLNNSYDYLHTSLIHYKIADEFGNHDDERSNLLNKQKWKTAFVMLVQAVELLLKQVLFDIHPNLIRQDIDVNSNDIMKTVSLVQAINRVNIFSDVKILDEKIEFIIKCAQLRNEFTHYKVEFNSQQMKKKYAMLYHLYKAIHDDFIINEVRLFDERQKSLMQELDNFTDDMVIFRGGEYKREQYLRLVDEIESNRKIEVFVDSDGISYNRIRYGSEANDIGEAYLLKYNIVDRTPIEVLGRNMTYCGACEAKQGEFHLSLCDMEICPKCLGQLLSCGCFPVVNEHQ